MHDGRCMNHLLACFHACASAAAPTTLPCLHCTTARVRIGFPFFPAPIVPSSSLQQPSTVHGRTHLLSVDGASSAEAGEPLGKLKRGKSVPALPYWCRRSCMHQPVRGPVRARAQMTQHTTHRPPKDERKPPGRPVPSRTAAAARGSAAATMMPPLETTTELRMQAARACPQAPLCPSCEKDVLDNAGSLLSYLSGVAVLVVGVVIVNYIKFTAFGESLTAAYLYPRSFRAFIEKLRII